MVNWGIVCIGVIFAKSEVSLPVMVYPVPLYHRRSCCCERLQRYYVTPCTSSQLTQPRHIATTGWPAGAACCPGDDGGRGAPSNVDGQRTGAATRLHSCAQRAQVAVTLNVQSCVLVNSLRLAPYPLTPASFLLGPPQWFPTHRLTIPSTCVMMAITGE